MYGVVNEGGTGRCGRSAQCQSLRKNRHGPACRQPEIDKERNWDRRMRTTAGLSRLRPRNRPEIAVVALFENGGESYNAADRARCVESVFRQKSPALQSASAAAHPRVPAALCCSRLPLRLVLALGGDASVVIAYRFVRGIDWYLLAVTLILCALGVSADLQRHAWHQMAGRLVEADCLRERGLGSDVGGELRSIITRCWARCFRLYGLSVALLA